MWLNSKPPTRSARLINIMKDVEYKTQAYTVGVTLYTGIVTVGIGIWPKLTQKGVADALF